MQLVETYNVSKKEVVDLLTAVNAPYTHHDSTRMVKKLQEELDRVCDELMSVELRLNEKFDVLVDDFDNRMAEAKAVALEAQQLFFRSMEVRCRVVRCGGGHVMRRLRHHLSLTRMLPCHVPIRHIDFISRNWRKSSRTTCGQRSQTSSTSRCARSWQRIFCPTRRWRWSRTR